MLPTNAPPDDANSPIPTAMMNSSGHRLCEVGSRSASISTRAMTAAGTAAPAVRSVGTKRHFPTARTIVAAITTTNRPGPISVSGSESFEYETSQYGMPTAKNPAMNALPNQIEVARLTNYLAGHITIKILFRIVRPYVPMAQIDAFSLSIFPE
jgi:hypothetical protein